MKKITFMLFALIAFSWQSNAQLNEGFDAAGLPTGWTETELIGADANWASGAANNNNSSVQPRTGAGMAYFYEGSYEGETTRLESPSQDLTGLTSAMLTFHYTQVDWGGDQDELSIWYKDGVAGTWTMIQEYTGSVSTWTEVNIILPSASADYYIGFQGFSGYGRGITVDDVSIGEAPSCLAPGSLGVAITSTTEATLNWTATGSETDFTYEYGITGYAQGTAQIGGMPVVGMSSADITGLVPGTIYDFYVQANCGVEGDSAFSGPYMWTQPDMGESCGTAIVASIEADCGTATPITLDFTGAPSNVSTSCDTFNNYGLWITATTDAAGGLRINASAAVDMAIYDACGGIDIECFDAGIAPNVDVILTPNTQYYLYFWQEGTASTAVVDVCISLPPACLEPSGLAASTTGLDTVDIAWTAGNAETDWTYEYGVSPYTQGGGGTTGTVMTDPMLSLTGLTSGETYDIFVQANCGTGNGDSSYITTSWTQPVIGATCETAITVASLPYNTSDDTATYGDNYNASPGATNCGTENGYLNGDDVVYAYTAVADGTIKVAMSAIGSTYSGVFVYTDCANIGTECVAGYGNGSSMDDFNLDVSVTNGTTYYVVISTWAAPQSTAYTLDITEVLCADPSALMATNVTSTSADLGWTENGTSTSWNIELGEAGFTPTGAGIVATNTYPATGLMPATDYEFYVQTDCGASQSAWIGPMAFTTLVSCPAPTDLTAANFTETSADLSWTENGTSTLYNIELGAAGFVPTGTATESGVANPYMANGLTIATVYDYYVQADCGAVDGMSTWSGPFTFSTSCGTANVPYMEDFETGGACGSIVNEGTGNVWQFVTSASYGFEANHLRYSWNSANDANTWFFTQGINLTAGQDYTVAYDYGGTALYPEKLKVAIGTSASAAAMTTELADYPDVNTGTPTNAMQTFTAPADGVYYVGFQAYSDADQFYLHLDNISVDVALSVGDVENEAAFTYFPNPVKNTLTLNAQNTIEQITMYNMLGQEVLKATPNTVDSDLDMSNLQTGTYFVKVTIANITETIRVIKQ